MGLETGTYIEDLNENWPLGTDPKSQGDDHIRLVKDVLKNTLPGADQAYDLNALEGVLASGNSLAPFENLIIRKNTDSVVAVNAGMVILSDSENKAYIAKGISNLTVDITKPGVDGLDTGTEAASTWYYVYIIYDGTTVSGLISASKDAPTLPTGYTYAGLVGAFYNNSSSNIDEFEQKNNQVLIEDTTVLSGGTANSPTVVDLSEVVPDIALQWRASVAARAATNGGNGRGYIMANAAGLGYTQIRSRNQETTPEYGAMTFPMLEPQKTYYDTIQNEELLIIICGWCY